MSDITKNFSYKEFACKSGLSMPPNVKSEIGKLAENLQVLRDYFSSTITVTCGYRDPGYNAALRKKSKKVAKDSQHMYGRAADIKVVGYPPQAVYKAIETLIATGKMHQGGLGIYDTWVHYDTRGLRARWDSR